MAIATNHLATTTFDTTTFLSTSGHLRHLLTLKPKETAFTQGSPADAVFYIQTGRADLTVVSKRGKEATVTLLATGDFFGEEAMCGDHALRTSTATALTLCRLLRIEKAEMLRVLHDEHSFSDQFLQFILHRGVRTQADLVDQLFNSSERRLARALLLMADFDKPGVPDTLIPAVTQEALAEMIGTTRSRVSFFMNRFRQMGYIEYNGRIRVNKSLLNVVLHDQLPEQNAARPPLLDPPASHARNGKRAMLV